jgi:protein-tyrosine-phosphatase
MAAGLFRHLIADRPDDFAVVSAGISALDGFPATQDTLAALKEEGIDASDHRSQRLTLDMIKTADRIFVMERMHKDMVLQMAPAAKDKVFLLTQFASSHNVAVKEMDIPDPIRMSSHFYKNVLGIIRDCVKNIAEDLKNETKRDQDRPRG